MAWIDARGRTGATAQIRASGLIAATERTVRRPPTGGSNAARLPSPGIAVPSAARPSTRVTNARSAAPSPSRQSADRSAPRPLTLASGARSVAPRPIPATGDQNAATALDRKTVVLIEMRFPIVEIGDQSPEPSPSASRCRELPIGFRVPWRHEPSERQSPQPRSV